MRCSPAAQRGPLAALTTLMTRKTLKLALALALVLMLLLAGLLASPVWARTTLDLDAQQQPVALKDWGDFWLDSTGRLTAQQVGAATNAAWQPTQANLIYPLAVGQALWIKFTVPPAPDAERWYLEVPYPSINRASLFTRDSAGQWAEQMSGDLLAVSKWPVPHRHPLLPIAISAEVPTPYLLRLENGHSFGTQLQFVSESRLSYAEQRTSLILGIFFGLVGLAVLVSLLSAVSLRDPAYGYYALSATLMGLAQASATGIGGLHLWPNSPLWSDAAAYVLPTLALAAKLMFVSAAVALPERSAALHRVLTVVATAGVLAALAELLVPLDMRMTVLMSYAFAPQAMALMVLVWAWRRGDRFAPWLMLGMAPVVLATALIGARNLAWLPVSFWTVNLTQIGAAIELPVLMVILMLRSQHRRENTRRIQGLDRVDPSTGLINSHVFGARLVRMIARSERLKQQSAVMLIDIINTEQTERDYGRKAADDLPLRVAERLLSTAREIDSAARLADRRFGMLVEGPFNSEDAAMLGPRIVARCLMPFKGMHPGCVAQVRVAYALVPYRGTDAQNLLNRLEERLATALDAGDKRAVFMLTDSYTQPRGKARH